MKLVSFLSAATATLVTLSSIPSASASMADIDRPMTRGEFVFYVMSKITPADPTIPDSNCFALMAATTPPTFNLLFTDVSIDSPNAIAICRAMRLGLITGYSDGSFGDNKNINLAEAAKILVKAVNELPDTTLATANVWYEPYMDVLRQFSPENQVADPSSTVSVLTARQLFETLKIVKM